MELNIDNKKYWCNIEEWELYNTWYKFKEQLIFMVGFNPPKDIYEKAHDYLTDNYEEYKKFKNKY